MELLPLPSTEARSLSLTALPNMPALLFSPVTVALRIPRVAFRFLTFLTQVFSPAPHGWCQRISTWLEHPLSASSDADPRRHAPRGQLLAAANSAALTIPST